ncbi:hypothetical protein C8F04DRAFT_1258410 [Mycena alexandri]|uniref:Uncharacterized protein n=1 Tax=Mycena alexandri TaxID=1745969 RepID=A0AAD6T2B1_9AGAR|nr:hypothetical protein C8F04DRAFT_1258410 [Mycena alexandri]
MESCNFDAIIALFRILPDAMWRDLLAMTWDIRTFTPVTKIHLFLADCLLGTGLRHLALKPDTPTRLPLDTPIGGPSAGPSHGEVTFLPPISHPPISRKRGLDNKSRSKPSKKRKSLSPHVPLESISSALEWNPWFFHRDPSSFLIYLRVWICSVHSHDVNIFPAQSLPRSSFKTETTKIILSFDKRSCAHIPFVHCFTQTPSSVIICCRCNSNSAAASVHPSLSDGRTISTCSAKPYPQSGSIILQFPEDEVRLASSSQAVRVTPPFAFTAGLSFGHCILPSTTCPF